jgi:carbamoyl-phosphate synthase small subunit
MSGIITTESPALALESLSESTRYDDVDFVRTVTTDHDYVWDEPPLEPGAPEHRILVADCGLKYNILRLLRQRGCQVIAVPATMAAEEMLAMKPSGILLSPGPGDPQLLDYLVTNVEKLIGRVPMMGICLGHQILARAMGAQTFKLKFGHRGSNHPVKDLADGRVYITAQNHGYAVSKDSLPSELEISHINLNDDTIEGLRHRDLPVFTIQYHSEGSPGPHDNEYLFDHFLKLVQGAG